MRVIEPQKFSHDQPRRSRLSKKLLAVAALITIAAVIAGFVYELQDDDSADFVRNMSNDTTVEPLIVDQSDDTNIEPTDPPVSATQTLKIFADNEFKIFYDQLRQPGVSPLENPPEISGDTTADARIRKIAEDRGYRLRGKPSVELASVDGFLVQSAVVQPWRDLKAAAAGDGLQLSIVSAYRSVERQRSLYLSRLAATGATLSQVAAGEADGQVDHVLATSSIPGYSKHHTGYTIDLLCAGFSFENFGSSPCNDWITADNYKVAKEHGFIPSYPPEADRQGPDPEAWEYVWVGRDNLLE